MSTKITCYTLFDITQTRVMNRSKPGLDQDLKVWTYQRNTQCNFDTILQVISLRSQPEQITKPKQTKIKLDKFDKFGFMLEQVEDTDCPCWKFTFEIQHKSAFDDGISELGYLYSDCDGVPMILCGTEYQNLINFLDTSPEHRNIYFEVYNE